MIKDGESPFVFGVKVKGDAFISRLKKSLTGKDLIAITAPHTIEITDPILKLWLKKRVWKE